VAAAALYGPPLIVVDFGTATNFDCVNGARRLCRGRHRAGGW
jgi:pantothenate kinase type III